MNELHVYRNEVIEWFVAESKQEAVDLARAFLADHCGISEEEMDLDFWKESDTKRLTRIDEEPHVTLTCKEWAKLNGKGFLFTTEF